MALLHKTTRFALIASLVGFLVGNYANGTVLCIGADGHIEIEPAFSPCCQYDGDRHSSEPASEHRDNPANGAKECGDCRDISLSDEYHAPKATQRIALQLSLVALSYETPLARPNPPSVADILAAGQSGPPPQTLTSLRSIILLT